MIGWHHQLNGDRFGWTPGVGDGQGGLACCCSWGCKELDTTEHSLASGIQFAQHLTFIEESVLSPLYILGSFVVN